MVCVSGTAAVRECCRHAAVPPGTASGEPLGQLCHSFRCWEGTGCRTANVSGSTQTQRSIDQVWSQQEVAYFLLSGILDYRVVEG